MDEDEEGYGGVYENGHWIWNEKLNCLEYESTEVQEEQAVMSISSKPPTGGTVQFKDDVDVVDQIRFRRRYQRKIRPGDPDVITVQDVKDLALYTAPLNLLSPLLIDILHQSTTERFIRALILYCQYYLQVLEEMSCRKAEAIFKIRTQASATQEQIFATNLSDLRVLVAKEYSVMLIGGDDTMRFHHMGEHKKRKSLSNRDARLTETLLQMCTQIVWLSLGRKCYNQLELEIHRLFKSDTFNIVEHKLKTGFVEKMSPIERAVLLGNCIRHERKLQTRSPLSNELFCCREIDFSIMGVGAISYPILSGRVAYMANAISSPEDMLKMCGVTIGIIGMDRSRFDIMLRPLPAPADKSSKEVRSEVRFKRLSSIKKSTVTFVEKVYPDIVLPSQDESKEVRSEVRFKRLSSIKKSTVTFVEKVYPDIVLPSQDESKVRFPPAFPHNSIFTPTCCFVQRNRWQNRLKKLMKGMKKEPR